MVYLSPSDVAERLLSGSAQERGSIESMTKRREEGVPIFVGAVEAGYLLQAAGQETRRPQTTLTWQRTLEVSMARGLERREAALGGYALWLASVGLCIYLLAGTIATVTVRERSPKRPGACATVCGL